MSDIDLNQLEPADLLGLAYAMLEDMPDAEPVEKTAEATGEEELPDLNDLTVDEFLDFAEGLEEALAESGELEKVAGKISNFIKGVGSKAKGAGKRYGELLSGKNVRANATEVAGKTPYTGSPGRAKARAWMDNLRGRGSLPGRATMTTEARKSLGTQAATAAAAGGGGAAGIMAMRRKKK